MARGRIKTRLIAYTADVALFNAESEDPLNVPNERCSKTGENLVWLAFGLKITSVPCGELSAEELDLYRFFFDSDLVWKVDHVDAYGQCWLCVQHDESRYQLLTPLKGTYRTVPCDPAYPVPMALGRQHTISTEAVNDGV